MLYVLGEIGHYFAAARTVVALLGTASAMGVAGGLVVPRLVIQRRLRDRSTVAGSPSEAPLPASRVELGFAASLTGVLILICAALWTLLIAVTAHLDGYDALLTERFLHPRWLTLVLLATPLGFGLLLVSAASATVLVALQSWNRLVRTANYRASELFVVALAATMLGSAVVPGSTRPLVWALAGLLATFGAAIVAVIRDPLGADPVEERSPAECRRMPVSLLVTTALVAAVAGGSLGVALPTAGLPARVTAFGWTMMSAAGLVGVLLARVTPGRWPGLLSASPVLLLLLPAVWGGATLAAHWGAGNPAGWRLVALTGMATFCVSLTGRRAIAILGRTPPALAWVGAAAAVGYGVGLAAAALLL
jgi:hypothetical protein